MNRTGCWDFRCPKTQFTLLDPYGRLSIILSVTLLPPMSLLAPSPELLNPMASIHSDISILLTNGKQILFTDILGTEGKHVGRWEFNSSFITINGQTIQRPGNTAIADTGTTVIYIADSLLPSIYTPLGGKLIGNYWSFPTTVPASLLPSLSIPAGPHAVNLRPEDL